MQTKVRYKASIDTLILDDDEMEFDKQDGYDHLFHGNFNQSRKNTSNIYDEYKSSKKNNKYYDDDILKQKKIFTGNSYKY